MRIPVPARLDPVGRPRPPLRRSVFRLAVAAALALTAAAVLYAAGSGAPAADPAGSAASPSADSPAAASPATAPGATSPAAASPPASSPPADSAPAADPRVSGSPVGGSPSPAPASGSPAAARLPIPEGLVGVPVPLADRAVLGLLRAGDRVDLLAVPTAGADPLPLAGDVLVLAVDSSARGLMLALTPGQAGTVVSVPDGTAFALVVREQVPAAGG